MVFHHFPMVKPHETTIFLWFSYGFLMVFPHDLMTWQSDKANLLDMGDPSPAPSAPSAPNAAPAGWGWCTQWWWPTDGRVEMDRKWIETSNEIWVINGY